MKIRVCGAGAQFICGVWPSRLPYSTDFFFILWYLYLSVVFHYKYQSYKYEDIQQFICRMVLSAEQL